MDDTGRAAPKGRMTAQAIADRTGVSRSTVSRAFDPGSRISARVRRRILKIANEIGYRPTTAGRLAMKQNPSLVAVVVRDVTNPIRATIMTRLIRELEINRVLPLVFQVPNAAAANARTESFLSHLPKVVVTSGFMPPPSMIILCSQRGIPVLVINRGRIHGLAASFVSSDHLTGGRIAADELVRLGCKRIGFVSGQSVNDPDASEERIRGFLSALDAVGRRAMATFEGDHSYESGACAAQEMFALENPPDGVFCGNDMMALGFMDTARHMFEKNPACDYQLIGYDDIEMANWGAYRLTTVAQDMGAVINVSTQAIGILIEHPEKAINEVVPVKLVARRTTHSRPDG